MGDAPMKVMDFDAALATVLEHAARVSAPGVESVSLSESRGRVLAEEVRADRDQPPFDRSTRDGFAVRAADLAGDGVLRVVGQVKAGEVWRGGAIERGCAVGIMTGAPVPEGLDTVVMVEHVVQAVGSDGIRVVGGMEMHPGENVVPRGAEARAGARVLAVGTEIGAAEIALAASCGRAEIAVFAAAEGGDCGDGG